MDKIKELRALYEQQRWARDWDHNITPPGKPAQQLACDAIRALPALFAAYDLLNSPDEAAVDGMVMISRADAEELLGADITGIRDDGVKVVDLVAARPLADSFSASDGRRELPDDVRRLVIAARYVAFDGYFDGGTPEQSELIRELAQASEAFAARVDWEDQPEDDEIEPAPPAALGVAAPDGGRS